MKKAFTLIEMFFMIFIVGSVIFTVIPFSLTNMKQANIIADWKNYIQQANYSYETLLEYKKMNKLSEKEAISRYMSYMDAKKVTKDDAAIKNYKYKLLNYGLFRNDTLDSFDEIYFDIKNRIIAVKYEDECSTNTPCATVWVDMNGIKNPNITGRDIFLYEIYENSIEPYKKEYNIDDLRTDCSIGGEGLTCGKLFLLGGDLK